MQRSRGQISAQVNISTRLARAIKRHATRTPHVRQRTRTAPATVTSAATSSCIAASANPSSFSRSPSHLLLSRVGARTAASFHRGVRRLMSATSHSEARVTRKAAKAKKGEGGGAECIFCQLAPGPPLPLPPASLALAAPVAAADGGISIEEEDVDAAAPAAPAAPAPDSPHSRVLFADEHVYVVEDHRPAARLHLLVITHAHIRDCDTLDDDKLGQSAHSALGSGTSHRGAGHTPARLAPEMNCERSLRRPYACLLLCQPTVSCSHATHRRAHVTRVRSAWRRTAVSCNQKAYRSRAQWRLRDALKAGVSLAWLLRVCFFSPWLQARLPCSSLHQRSSHPPARAVGHVSRLVQPAVRVLLHVLGLLRALRLPPLQVHAVLLVVSQHPCYSTQAAAGTRRRQEPTHADADAAARRWL